METLLTYLTPAATVAVIVLVLLLSQRLLRKPGRGAGGHVFRNQLIMLALTAAGVFLIILVLPIGDTMRGQLLSLIGIVLSAAIALSSTTVLGNALAGLMLRAVRGFRMGDFIRVGEHFGRVSERGLFHTEIQTEERELVTLPNLHLVTHPVSTIRTSGTIISTCVSLGYDVPRQKVEDRLLEAARRSELADPFVHVVNLGDVSVSYRVSGLLTEVKQLISVRSRLRGNVLDSLHEAGVEIVSPNFMNTRALEPGRAFIPVPSRVATPAKAAAAPEEVVFDKAEEAESMEAMQAAHKELAGEIETLRKQIEELPVEGADRAAAERVLERMEARLDRMKAAISGCKPEASKEG